MEVGVNVRHMSLYRKNGRYESCEKKFRAKFAVWQSMLGV